MGFNLQFVASDKSVAKAVISATESLPAGVAAFLTAAVDALPADAPDKAVWLNSYGEIDAAQSDMTAQILQVPFHHG
jgi:hypothetical protein